jgi:hypothetical protein
MQPHRNQRVAGATVHEDVFQYELDEKPSALIGTPMRGVRRPAVTAGRNMVDHELSPGKRSYTSLDAIFSIGVSAERSSWPGSQIACAPSAAT